MPIDFFSKSPFGNTSTHPNDIDELSAAAREVLLDRNLEVSKVRPFFWSMVEAYVDRFQIYPFDIVKAMLSYLETRDFPEEQTRELVEMLEQGYQEQHGVPLNDKYPALELDDSLNEELRELRASLKYAAMVAERESQD